MDDVLTFTEIQEIFEDLGLAICDDPEAIRRQRLERSTKWKQQALSPNRKTQERAQRREALCRRLEEHLDEQMAVVRDEVSRRVAADGLSADERQAVAARLSEELGLQATLAERFLTPPSSAQLAFTKVKQWGRRLSAVARLRGADAHE